MKKIYLVILAATLLSMAQARATLFELSYSDSYGNTLDGLISATFIGGNEYQATSASLVLASPNVAPGLDGTFTLAASDPAFVINNVLYYPGSPIVDFYGVLGLQNGSGTYLNLFSADASGNPDVAGNYALLAANGGGYISLYPSNASSNIGGPATASLTPIPEASTLVAGALMVLPLGVSAIRIMRKSLVV